jgi:parallel beta-helix repeat protein
MIMDVWQGVLIGWGSSDNRVVNNKIYLVQQSGISFEGGNEYNRVLANKINCQPDVECMIVNIDNPPLSTTNKIKGNKFIR